MKLLTKDQILSAPDLKTEIVDVPLWGGAVRVSEMGGSTYLDFIQAVTPVGADESVSLKIDLTYMATAVAFSVIDDAGEPLFTVADVKRLARKNMKALRTVFAATDRLNILTRAAQEEAEKNFERGEASAEPCSPSPANSDSQASGT